MPRKKKVENIVNNGNMTFDLDTGKTTPYTEISCKLIAVIPTAEYANIQPCYEIIQQVPKGEESKSIDEMRKLLQSKIDADYEMVRIKKFKEQFKDIKISEKDGKHFVHVTSVLEALSPIDYPKELLMQYASRGTLVHAIFEHFLRTQQWEFDVLKIPGTKLDYQIVTKGSLGLKISDCDPKGFWEAHGKDFAIMDVETKVYNEQYLYCGTRDMLGRYKGKLSIIDIKTSASYTGSKLDRYWKQCAAYAKCEEGVEQLVIIPLNPKKGFEKPIVTDEVDKYFDMFLQDREALKQMYNV